MSSAALPRRPPADPRQLQRCLLLAVLLHVWLVLVFGNASGTAAPGQGVWGSLTVKLLGRSGSDAGAPPGETPPAQRPGSSQAPGAADLGRWNPREVPPDAARTDETSPAPPSTATLDLPDGFQPIEREALDTPPPRRLAPNESPVLPMTPAESLKAAPPAPLQAPAPDLPATVGRLETRPEAGVTPLPAPASLRTPSRTPELPPLPADLPAPVRRLEATPQGAVTPLPRAAELRAPSPVTPAPVTTPSADLPAPVRRLEAATDSAVAPLQRPADLRAPGATIAAPVTPPSAELPAAVRRLEAPTAEGAVTALPRATELRQATAAPAAPINAGARDLPAPVRRLEAADGSTAAPVTPLQAATGTRPTAAATAASALPELSTALPGQVAGPAAPTGPARGDPAADAFAAPKASAGSPDAGPRLGPSVPAPPTAAASAPRAPLNLSLPRGDMTAKRSLGLVELLPPPPERKSKLEQSIEDTANKDCRKAYSNAGILAAVPLALDAARGKGCKW
ncbi:MAG: hypothetical protein HY020_26650 [Burkholderiales bacterium]|nr:hypothetical protein [Burkholderiales bacterium]